MELQGKITAVLPLQTGNGQNGEWKLQEYVLLQGGEYPKKACFQIWNDKIDKIGLAIGDDVVADVNVESREHNGRYYTNLTAWKVDVVRGGGAPSDPMKGGIPQPEPVDDSLPF